MHFRLTKANLEEASSGRAAECVEEQGRATARDRNSRPETIGGRSQAWHTPPARLTTHLHEMKWKKNMKKKTKCKRRRITYQQLYVISWWEDWLPQLFQRFTSTHRDVECIIKSKDANLVSKCVKNLSNNLPSPRSHPLSSLYQMDIDFSYRPKLC